MIEKVVSRRISMLAALAIALMVGFALAMPAQALANDTALTVGTQADEVITKDTAKSYTWVKAGKKLYQWSNYDKKIVNGTLKPRETMTLYFSPTEPTSDEKVKITNVASSNKNVISAKAVAKSWYMKYTSKKNGTAVVTYTMTYTNADGQKVVENVTETHKIVKYVRPIKTFKVGSKNYAAKFKSTPQVNAKSALSGKLTVKAASGWKVKKIRQVNSAITSGEFVPQKKLKNGAKVNIKKSAQSAIEVICYNTKGKYYSSVVLGPNFTYSTIAG